MTSEKKLLANRANANHRTPFGWTPLTAAIQGGFFQSGPEGNLNQTVNALLSNKADVNLPGTSGWTPLMMAVFKGDIALVRRLISKGADLSAKDEKGKTASDYARERSALEISAILNR